MRLTVAQQRKLLKALPAHRVSSVRKVCKEQGGSGIKDVMAKARKALGPLAQEIGPTVLKEFVMPMIMKKISGGALRKQSAGTARFCRGSGLRLAGQRGVGKRKKKKPRKKT